MAINEIGQIVLSFIGGGALIRAGVLFLIRKNNADLDETIQYRRIRDQRMQELEKTIEQLKKERDEGKAHELIVEEKIRVLTDQAQNFQRQLEESNRLLKGIQQENTALTRDVANLHLELNNAKLERDNAAARLQEKHEELEKERSEKTALQNQFNGFREALSFLNVLIKDKAELKEINING